MKVLVADSIAKEGIEMLAQVAEVDVKTGLSEEQLLEIIADYDAMIVRSQTQVTEAVIAAAGNLQVIGRAGAGVDNIKLPAATARGIIVVNAPGGNTISAAEHSVAMMLALSRHIPQANASLKSGKWKRNEFMGTEVRDKTLGVIGLGRIGTEVAKRAQGLQMRVIGYDPFISEDYARNIQVELVSLPELFRLSDYITLHIPRTEGGKYVIGKAEIAKMKSSVRIINCARGGLIDEAALVKAIQEKRVAGAAIDVYVKEPCTESVLFGLDQIIVTPHLGASTTEAQTSSAVSVARQIMDIFSGLPAAYAVNAPLIPPETISLMTPFLPLGTAVGRLVSQISDGQLNSIKITYEGEISEQDPSAIKAAILGGLLEHVSEERVNLVNANLIAAQRGLEVVEQKDTLCKNYASLVTVEVKTSKGVTTVAGTVLHDDEPHIVRINDYWLSLVPTPGHFLLSEHVDRPGLIGAVGTITGQNDVNVSYMHLGRLKARGEAIMVLALDEALSEKTLEEIRALDGVHWARMVKL